MIPFSHRQPGDPVELSATEINAWNAAAREHRGGANRQTAPTPRELPEGVAVVKNTTGEKRKRFDVLALSGPLLSTDAADYKRIPAFKGTRPNPEVEPTHRHRVAVLLEPVGPDKFARAAVFGQFAMPVDVLDTSHTRARVLDDYTVQSGCFGPLRILGAPGTGDETLCRVFMDGFDGGHCFVKVPSDGIFAGTWESPRGRTCIIAWPDSSGAAVEVPEGKNRSVSVTHYGPAIQHVDYVQCRIVGGFITPDVAYCDD